MLAIVGFWARTEASIKCFQLTEQLDSCSADRQLGSTLLGTSYVLDCSSRRTGFVLGYS